MIEILATGALATVQDHGRSGALKWGVGASGALDNLALAAGNILLGNDECAAGIELQIFPFQARFTEDCAFAITGAEDILTSPGYRTGLSCTICTSPLVPNPGQRRPVRESTAMMRKSLVPIKIRVAHTAAESAAESRQKETPRQL